jgi:hypothetical protein
MNHSNDNTCKKKDKLEIIKELLKKQGVDDEKKQNILNCLNYLEFQKKHNKDDIFLKKEIETLFYYIL